MKNIALAIVLIFSIGLLSCNQNNESQKETGSTEESKDQNLDYVKKGKSIATATFATLSGELGKALKEGGVSQAVEVCNIAAMPLVDSLSKVHNATIRRTSLKIRNPKNVPSSDELKVLNDYAKKDEAGEKLGPQIIEVDGMVSFLLLS